MTKLLANTFYNPLVDVQPRWTNTGNYKLIELKTVINACIDKDNHVLTQFIEPDKLKKVINYSNTFDEICQTLFKYVFDVDEKELLKEEN